MQETTLIAESDALDTLARQLAAAERIAVDTEFVRETTYYPNLCLVQVACGDTVAALDCLADIDLTPFLNALFRPDCTWVLHSGRQDLEVVWNLTGRMPARLIDTQVAAGLIGHAPQISLGELLSAAIGVDLDKSHARTDWMRRPIADAPLRYALDDVRYLLAVWDALAGRLDELGRREWFAEDCSRLLATAPVSDTATIWSRLRGIARLDTAAQHGAYALVAWREREAQRLNRPRRWILGDAVLVEIARRRPASVAELAAVPEMPRRLASRSGTAILDAMGNTDRDAADAEMARAARRESVDKARVKALQAEVGRRAVALNLHPEVVATRRDLTDVAAGMLPEHLATGWRAAALADVLPAAARQPAG